MRKATSEAVYDAWVGRDTVVRVFLAAVNALLINIGFLLAFFVRYGLPFPEDNFLPYKSSFPFLTLIYIGALAAFGVYKSRFSSSWELFRRVFSGLFLGTLLSIAFVYVFRVKWNAFPTTIFVISFFVNLLLIFKLSRLVLRACKKIRKKVVVVGKGNIDEIVTKNTAVERIEINEIEKLAKYSDIDEIVICERIQNESTLNLLAYLVHKFRVDIVFSPSVYMRLLPEKINGESSIDFLNTFIGRKRDIDEFLIKGLDVIGSILILLLSMPLMLLVSVLIRISSPGSVLYKQQRVGKDGKIFTLYKFRTMTADAEKQIGPVLAQKDDPRVTKIGKLLRQTRLDELPQLFNVLIGNMSLVGPRPERPHFAKLHKALQGIRLAVKPGITGLAQIRSFYDLHPKHKIRYDYLYIQRRSLLLNLYILTMTIPVVLLKKRSVTTFTGLPSTNHPANYQFFTFFSIIHPR